jgi:Ulp1 family protease
MAEHDILEGFCRGARIKLHDLDNYTKALVQDDKAEKAKRRKAPSRTRKGKNKLSNAENKLLVVYPFEVAEEKLRNISSRFKELSGDRLGVAETVPYESTTEDEGEDAAQRNASDDEEDENTQVGHYGSSRSHYLTIREDEMERLEPGQFLNDTLVDFWMSW